MDAAVYFWKLPSLLDYCWPFEVPPAHVCLLPCYSNFLGFHRFIADWRRIRGCPSSFAVDRKSALAGAAIAVRRGHGPNNPQATEWATVAGRGHRDGTCLATGHITHRWSTPC
ncbi:hypothetical protein ACLOJK_019114 [Asimina triloba]